MINVAEVDVGLKGRGERLIFKAYNSESSGMVSVISIMWIINYFKAHRNGLSGHKIAEQV